MSAWASRSWSSWTEAASGFAEEAGLALEPGVDKVLTSSVCSVFPLFLRGGTPRCQCPAGGIPKKRCLELSSLNEGRSFDA